MAVLLFVKTNGQDGRSAIIRNAEGSVYQYSVPVGPRQAYLWIPPACVHVRGVIISLSNLLERDWLEDPLIRQTATEEGLGIIWVGPGGKGATLTADLAPGGPEALQQMMKDLAQESGYAEIEWAPFIAMGHSANGHFSWKLAAWDPGRTIAAIPIKTIPLPDVDGRIDHFSIDVKGQRAFLAALAKNTIEAVDLKGGRVIQTLPGFAKPQGVQFVGELNKLFVATGVDGALKTLDGGSPGIYRHPQAVPPDSPRHGLGKSRRQPVDGGRYGRHVLRFRTKARLCGRRRRLFERGATSRCRPLY